MLSTLVRRSAAPAKPTFNFHTNPYKAKKEWPPDFTKLSSKYQFRLERRYRRRAKLKWARPRWTKAVKLAQWGSAVFILTYGVLFMDWGNEKTPFKGVREWYHGLLDSMWTSRGPPLRTPEQPTGNSNASAS
ncbi:hypothetical protein LTR16_002852 [Cryomyces antarcticus]|uniref:Uncharacterized protein n=1 Tax=Cryomyces antarcticus TaxID=329879 RepID=A0ABR0LZY2_9PEZI|nr:hypothetical protein LTR16_002852 [Cryomyces antarcticus]